MGNSETPAPDPATKKRMTADLNAALEAGDLDRIMGTLGEMARAHRMRRVARETGLGRESLYKSRPIWAKDSGMTTRRKEGCGLNGE